jgi:hypothetical protein
MVDAETAHRVAHEELQAYERALTGFHGQEEHERAATEGLRGIAEEVIERPGAWLVFDLITREQFVRPFRVAYNETEMQRTRRLLTLRRRYPGLKLEHELEKGG